MSSFNLLDPEKRLSIDTCLRNYWNVWDLNTSASFYYYFLFLWHVMPFSTLRRSMVQFTNHVLEIRCLGIVIRIWNLIQTSLVTRCLQENLEGKNYFHRKAWMYAQWWKWWRLLHLPFYRCLFHYHGFCSNFGILVVFQICECYCC